MKHFAGGCTEGGHQEERRPHKPALEKLSERKCVGETCFDDNLQGQFIKQNVGAEGPVGTMGGVPS